MTSLRSLQQRVLHLLMGLLHRSIAPSLSIAQRIDARCQQPEAMKPWWVDGSGVYVRMGCKFVL